ncbi:MAG: ribose 5-phosphate isomerase B [Gemmatimonadaceae bacterium]|nr:ribose 5-phosphate isomerase B [Gemmatimonadaceae bacterium]
MPRRRLISERDVVRAHRDGATSMDVTGAVVTPSARDAAAARGVTLADGRRTPQPIASARVAPTPSRAGPLPAKNRSTQKAQPDAGALVATKAPPVQHPSSAAPGRPRIALGADHGGVALKDTLLAFLRERGHAVSDLGTFGTVAVDYPDFAITVARAVAEGRADLGIMIDGAGIGSCMAANKVPGVRAAMCYDVTTAGNAREHNNANLLTLGGTLIGARLAAEIVRTFLDTPFAGGRHAARVDKIDALLPAPRPLHVTSK